ncbi:hypothetical protein S245_055765, partial [Arachis hypogaea]
EPDTQICASMLDSLNECLQEIEVLRIRQEREPVEGENRKYHQVPEEQGYVGIIFEESLAFNKSGVGLLMAVSLWTIKSIG